MQKKKLGEKKKESNMMGKKDMNTYTYLHGDHELLSPVGALKAPNLTQKKTWSVTLNSLTDHEKGSHAAIIM